MLADVTFVRRWVSTIKSHLRHMRGCAILCAMANDPKKAAGDDHVGVRIKRSLRRRINTYAASKEMDKQEALDEAVEEYLKKRGA